MTTVKRSISVTEQQARWIREQIDSGHYNNESELFRDLIRDRIRREAEIEKIQEALIEGERSGISSRSAEDVWAEARKRQKQKSV